MLIPSLKDKSHVSVISLPTGSPEVRVLCGMGSQTTSPEKERWEGSGIHGSSEEVEG